jgi:hypothetical protein
MRGVGLLATGLILAAGSHASAQNTNLLTNVKRLKCSFGVSTAATWSPAGEASAQVRTTGMLNFEVTDIDTQESTANIVGLSSTGHIVAQLHGWNLHLLDIRPSGSLGITTVFAQESRDKRLKAVHTRTDYLPVDIPGFTSRPDVFQYYGECEIVQ